MGVRILQHVWTPTFGGTVRELAVPNFCSA